MSTITVTLLNWKRPANLRRLMDSLHAQTLRPRVFLWNNGDAFLDPRADLVVQSSRNLRCWPRWLLASLAETEYVCSLDDDLALRDDDVLEDLVQSMDEDAVGDRVYGLDGLIIPRGSSYRQGQRPAPEALAPVDVVKGRMMALHRAALATVGLLQGVTEDDITICGLLARGRERHHRVIGWLHGRVEELPETHALAHQPGHYDRRDAAVRQYLHV
jgi:hypothetical protein